MVWGVQGLLQSFLPRNDFVCVGNRQRTMNSFIPARLFVVRCPNLPQLRVIASVAKQAH